MAEYDGSIRIGTGIDTKGFKEGEKEIEAESRRTAESVSKTMQKSAEQIEKDLEGLTNVQKRFLEAGGLKENPVYKDYEKRIQKLKYSLKSLQDEQERASIADEHWNQLKIDVEEYAKSLKELQTQGKFFGDEDYDRVYIAWKNATDAVKEYQAELNKQTESGKEKIAEQEAKATERREVAQRKAEEQAEKALQKENDRIQKQIENEAKLQAKEAERQAKLKAEAVEAERLDKIRLNAVATNNEIIAKVERIKQLEQEIADLKKVGRTEGYTDYDNRIRELTQLKKEIGEYGKEVKKIPEQFNKMQKSAKKAFSTISSSTKQSNASLSGGLKTILKYGFGIRSLYVLFNKIRSGITSGFKNLMDYSDDFANSVQGVKNSMSTLGNQIAAAFSPVVQMVLPWITKLISAISTAMTYVAQFFTILGGKSTFTRAKQVQDSYNKSLGGTAAAAKKAYGALAKFDDLDVLQKKDEDEAGGAGDVVGDMFEEVPVDPKFKEWLDGILEKLKPILDYLKKLKDIFMEGFWDGLGDWEYRLQIIKDALASIKDSLIDIFTDPSVLAAADKWAQSVAYMLGSLVGSMASIGLTIAANLLGGIAKYLEENKERIKSYLVDMFDIWADINYLLADLFQSFAYVFEAFASEDGQQLTANLIGIFVDAFMGVTEIASKLIRDILNIFIQPFVDNKEEFRTALEGFLGVLASVTGTIKDGIDATFDKLNEVYDAHFKPFFDSIAQGLSDLVGKFLEFWNGSVQPILEKWAQKFDEVWQEHIQPMINSFIELFGQVLDALKDLWENILQPFIAWIIENILPVILPILDGIVDGFLEIVGGIADAISGIIEIISGIITFLVGVFTADWEKAWEGITKIFEGVKDTIKGIINGISSAVMSIITGIKNAIMLVINILTQFWNETLKPIIDWIVENILPVILPIIEGVMSAIELVVDGIGTAIESIITVLKSIIQFLVNVFTADWKDVWNMNVKIFEGVRDAIKGIINGILGFVESLANGVVKAINTVIRALNALKIDIPDWVPGIGGGTLGFNLAEIPEVSIPRLATGAVIRGGNPFMAILGDQPSGQTNIEAPLKTIEQAVENVMSRRGEYAGVGNINADMTLDGETIGRLIVPYILDEMKREGLDVNILGVT